MRLIIEGVERTVSGELPDPKAVEFLGRDSGEVMLERISDGRYAGDVKRIGEVFEDGDDLRFVPRPPLL